MSAPVLVFLILAAALVLFVTGWLRMDLVALLVLGTLAITGLVTPEQALSGFSSPAVVTVWAMFILSAGLSKTGVANLLGRPLLRFSRGPEVWLMVTIMAVAGLLSALVNTVTVAAILLPVVMDVARRGRRPPSRLLLPLALGCLLGGPFTAISTPPNILVTDAMRVAGLKPFGLFDFTPLTFLIVVTGIAFMALVGRRWLPAAGAGTPGAGEDVQEESFGRYYQLPERLFTTRIAEGSPLTGKTLGQSRLGSALHLNVLAILRDGRLKLAPEPDEILRAGDRLIVHGRPEPLERLRGHQHLVVEPTGGEATQILAGGLALAEARLTPDSELVGRSLYQGGFRRRFRVNVLALRRNGEIHRADLQRLRLEAGDILLLQGQKEDLDALAEFPDLQELRPISGGEALATYGLQDRLIRVRVPEGSILAGQRLADSRLGDALGLTVLGILRNGDTLLMPHPDEMVEAGDILILQGTPEELAILEALQELELSPQPAEEVADLESQEVGATEVVLSPRTAVAGKTFRELRFRDRYGLTVLAIWREGRPYRSGLRDMALRFGDALLVYGHRRSLEALARDPDFVVLDAAAAQAPRPERAPLAAAIMGAVLLSAMAGWIPIAIAAVSGAALMILARCLTMEEAYRAIDWQAVFLIAGMLPLGAAMDQSGAAVLVAEAILGSVGDWGPRAVVAGIFLITSVGTQVVPNVALVVLMAPVALNAAATLGISPHLLMMTVAFGASASYASPVSHPAHVLVMGPGGYRFIDYVKVGGPMTLVVFVLVLFALPVLWPP